MRSFQVLQVNQTLNISYTSQNLPQSVTIAELIGSAISECFVLLRNKRLYRFDISCNVQNDPSGTPSICCDNQKSNYTLQSPLGINVANDGIDLHGQISIPNIPTVRGIIYFDRDNKSTIVGLTTVDCSFIVAIEYEIE